MICKYVLLITSLNERKLMFCTKLNGLVWFLCLMAYQLFLGYLMPKPFS